MQSAVIDASVALKWVVDEPDSVLARSLAPASLFAPPILRAECGNALWRMVTIGVLTKDEAAARVDALCKAPITYMAPEGLEVDAFSIACDLDHPLYDCLYLALAASLNLPFVTADRRLLTKAARVALPPALIVRLQDLQP